jgi:hypothetical protein
MEQHAREKNVSDKILTAFSVLLLAATIGVMGWHDLRPQSVDREKEINIVTGYYAGDDATAAMIPGDDMPVTIAQGEFKYTVWGRAEFTRRGMPPATFAQRQINLLLRFDALPKKPEETFAKIKALADDWANQGNIVSVIYLDYRPENPDFNAYSGFMKGLKKYFKVNSHLLVPVADISWIEDRQKKAGLQLLRKDTPFFLVELNKPELPAGSQQKLENAGYGFQLKLPAEAISSDFDGKALKKTGFFVGGMLTLGPHQNLLKQEPKIGIFPRL